jgi:hypothetical protein
VGWLNIELLSGGKYVSFASAKLDGKVPEHVEINNALEAGTMTIEDVMKIGRVTWRSNTKTQKVYDFPGQQSNG